MNAIEEIRLSSPPADLSAAKRGLLEKRLKGAFKGGVKTNLIPKLPRHDGVALSFAQQRLWFLDQMESNSPLYNLPQAIRLSGSLNVPALEKSLAEIVRRHQTLRTTFEAVNGKPVQRISSAPDFKVTLMDLRQVPESRREEDLNRLLTSQAQRPFDLTRDVMLRASLFRLEETEHVLLLNMHHIASDAWSVGLLLEEMAALYQAFSAGAASPLPDLPVQYADFAVWQRECLQGEALQKQLAYWKQQIRGALPVLELSADHPRPAVQTFRGATESARLPSALYRALKSLNHQEGVTLFITLLAVFQTLLHRYTGQQDIVVGSPIAGRNRTETERLIGLFVNTLIMRSDFSGNPSFRVLLQRVREVALGAYSHQDLPFEKLVEELRPKRHVSHSPLFQVMFSLQQSLPPSLELPGLILRPFDIDYGMSPFDLTLLVEETERDLHLLMEYNTDLFEKETIQRMLGHFRILLESVVANPRQHVASLPMLSEAERHQILVEWNRTEADYPRDKCIHELFEEQAARTPNAIAVSFGQEQWSYVELNARANQVARYLQKLGVGPGMLVGLCMQRSLELCAGVLGILKVGAGYLSMDPVHPKERLAFKLADSQARVLLTQEAVSALFAETHVRPQTESATPNDLPSGPVIICLDKEWERIAQENTENTVSSVQPEHLVYVIYTSGSTGKPKGVLTPHRALVNHSTYFKKRFALDANDRVLQFAPLNFDVSAEELFPAWLSGATVVIRPEALSASVDEFHGFLIRERLTVLNLPTPYWDAWMEEISRARLELPECLRLVVVGSEAVSAEQYARWQRLVGRRIRWCNAYGTTEDTITSAIFEPVADEKLAMVPIGRPIANTQVFILDEHLQPLPVGVPGALYVGGDELAHGYLNQPELTTKKFIADPFSDQPNARLYQTGDLARYRPDGNIEFLGRADYQVKIRGFRIELGEIESVLSQHPQVKDAVATAREVTPNDKRIVAYYIPAPPSPPSDASLISFLKEKLPNYMVPSAFVPLKGFPLTPSGKIDRKALPDPGTDRPELDDDFVPPSTSYEELLAKVWREVLGLKSVGIHDNFFDLGGHSLLAIRLFAQMESLTGRKLSVMTLFHSPTIAQLAEILRRKETAASYSSLVAIQEHGSKPPLYLIHGAGGGMLWGYANLARYLERDQPVYGLNSRGMERLDEFSTIEEMAAQYVEEICEFQPEGPYYLGGYCFGGEVAFEMARQLMTQGRQVALLALLNAMPPNSSYEKFSPTPRLVVRFLANACLWFDYFRRWTPEQRRNFMRRKSRVMKKKLKGIIGLPNRDAPGIEAEDLIDLSPYPEYQRRLWDTHIRASRAYRPKPYPGHITLFRTRIHTFFCSFDPAFGWGDLAAGGVTVKMVPGAHESILEEPHVWTLAEEMKRFLTPNTHPWPEAFAK